MKSHKETYYIVLLIIESVLLGAGNPIAKLGMSVFPFFGYVAARFLLGCVFLLLVFHKHIRYKFHLSSVMPCLIISMFTACAFIVGTLAFKYTTATNAGFLFSLPVIFTPFLSFFISKKRMKKTNILPILFVIVGLYFLCCGQGGFTLGLGEGLAILSAISIACTYEFSAKYVQQIDAIVLATFQAGFIGSVCIGLSIVTGETFPNVLDVPLRGWLVLLYLGIGCTGIGYCLQNYVLSKLNSTKVALIFCSQPIFTAMASYAILGELLTPIGFVGAFIIMGSIVLASALEGKTTTS
ncbi:MAG: DMT family transporter [Lachnospiraceae bacterium]